MVRSWFSRSHSGLQELGALAVLYAFYEVVRGVPSENVDTAMRHTSEIVALEQSVGIYVEHGVQGAFDALPVLPTVLGFAYLSLHFVGTAAALVWLHRRHPEHFPIVRTTLVTAIAAVPSLHFGYALIVGVALATLASHRIVRVAGALYPLAMLLVIVGTGNHFVFDAALGAVVVVAGWLVARFLVEAPAPATRRERRVDERPEPCCS